MNNALDIIKEDHEEIRGLFTTYNGYTENDDEQRKETAHEILRALTTHAKMEEKYFYPRLKEKMDALHPLPIDQAEAEHHAAKMIIMELKIMPITSETYDARMSVLEENALHHMEEEESDLLPHAEELLKDDLEGMGKEMGEYRDEARKTLLEKLLGE